MGGKNTCILEQEVGLDKGPFEHETWSIDKFRRATPVQLPTNRSLLRVGKMMFFYAPGSRLTRLKVEHLETSPTE